MAGEKQTAGKRQKARLPLIGAMSNRGYDPAKDQRFVNAFPETRKVEQLENTRIYINKRPGLTEFSNVTTNGLGRGLAFFYDSFYAIIADKVYRVESDGTTITLKITLTTSTGPCSIISCNSSVIGDYLFICDGVEGWVIKDDHSATEVTDVDFPTPHAASATFIDGYVLVAKGSDVFNCDLDDPFTWQADQYLSAEMFPDPIKALARQNNQVVVLGEYSTEFFYDAANATASPLAREASAVQQFGTPAPRTVVLTEKEVLFVGATNNGGYTVWTIEGFKEKEISVPYIRSVLEAEGSALVDATAFCVRAASQKLYVICLTNKTLVYSFDTKLWTEWNSGSQNFLCGLGNNGPTGTPYLLHKTTGVVYKLTETAFTDGGTAFTCSIVTPKLDFETVNRKTCSRFVLVGDLPDDTLVDSTVYLSWSDDDYKTWSTPRAITFNADLPQLKQLGMFRRRAFRITYALPHLLRLEGAEIDINKGGA